MPLAPVPSAPTPSRALALAVRLLVVLIVLAAAAVVAGLVATARASQAAHARPAPDVPPAPPMARQPCAKPTNCVGSAQPQAAMGLPAIPYVQGARAPTEARLRAVIDATPGATLVATQDDRWHAEFRTRLFGFVDDVHFAFDDARGVVDFRSASRVGESDFGANRARMEAILRAMTASTVP